MKGVYSLVVLIANDVSCSSTATTQNIVREPHLGLLIEDKRIMISSNSCFIILNHVPLFCAIMVLG